MTIEEEIARTLRDFLQPEGFEVAESDRIFAQRLSPLLNRVRVEGAVQTLRGLSDKYAGFTSEDPLQRLQFASASAFMAAEAIAIEQNSEGNET